MADLNANLKVLNMFLGKADAKDKLTGLIQYIAMFASAGEPGNWKKVQFSVAAARKVFRVMRPLEALVPLITSPGFAPGKPIPVEALTKLRMIMNAVYFGCDHLVWASQAGLLTDKALIERFQKGSLYGWLTASSCTIAVEAYELSVIAGTRRGDESDEAWRARKLKAHTEINTRLLTLIHASIQAALALGLLGLPKWKPRFVGLLGVLASGINCCMLYPPLPAAPKALPDKGKAPEASLGGKLQMKTA